MSVVGKSNPLYWIFRVILTVVIALRQGGHPIEVNGQIIHLMYSYLDQMLIGPEHQSLEQLLLKSNIRVNLAFHFILHFQFADELLPDYDSKWYTNFICNIKHIQEGHSSMVFCGAVWMVLDLVYW
jgi:hypothetical protein